MNWFSKEINGIKITVFEEEGKIIRISLGDIDMPSGKPKKTKTIEKYISQLEEYFAGKRKTFDIPIKLEGTPFHKKVWEALQKIPYGGTRTYGEIAKAIGSPKAARAVGGANNKNPIGIVVPCHRVIGADGSLTGYACGLEIKKYLLDLERENR